jgi:hypothetical protein
MVRKYNAKHPLRGKSNYKKRVIRNGGADRYGRFVNGDRLSADRLLKEKG